MIILKNVSSKLIKDYEDKSLEYVDGLNYGKVLLLSNPASYSTVVYRSIEHRTIKDFKNYFTPNDEGIVRIWARNVGEDKLTKIITAVDMYTEQVERQARLTDDREINLFEYQGKEKREIVEDKYAYIIAYLLCTGKKELIWGSLSEPQKKHYLSSITATSEWGKEIRQNIIDCISNYTTLPELEKLEKENYKVLNKFIKK